MKSRFGLLAAIALRHLSRRKRETVVAVSGVAVGVGFFLAVSALMVGSQTDFLRQLIDSAPHVIISDEIRGSSPREELRRFTDGAVALRGYRPRKEARGIKDWPAVMAALEATPGAVAAPSLAGGATLRLGGQDEAIQIIGVEPDIEARVTTISDQLRSGSLTNLETTQGGIIIGEELADRLGLEMGDIVAATSASGNVRSMRIAGLVKRGRTQIGAGTGFVLLSEAQALLARPFVINRIGVKLDDPYGAEDLAERLEARFGYKAQSWQERSADILALLVTRNVIMYSVVSAILLVASFGIYTVVSNSVSDKRRDIAIMRSIGFSQGDLQLIFVVEGVLLAALGVLLGWGLGTGLMGLLGTLEFPVGGDVEQLPMDRSPLQYAIAAAASFIAGTIAAWLPARKAASVDPVDILRGAT